MTKQYSISEARTHLPALVHAVEDGAPVELTRRGRTVAILMSKRDFDASQRGEDDPWSVIEAFRDETDLDRLDADDVWESVRSRAPGRDVRL